MLKATNFASHEGQKILRTNPLSFTKCTNKMKREWMYVVYARREITPPLQALKAGWEEKFMQHTSTENIRHIFLLLRIISA